MKKFLILFILLSVSLFVLAHSEDAELNAEIQKGKELFEKLQKGKIGCQNLTDEDFHSIGEYAMEQMVGGSDHLLMNQTMEKMRGKEAEELMHINMGKRFSGCEKSNFSRMGIMGWRMPMMGMEHWIGWWNPHGFWGILLGILGIIWVLIILAIPVLILILLVLGILYIIKRLKSEVKKPE